MEVHYTPSQLIYNESNAGAMFDKLAAHDGRLLMAYHLAVDCHSKQMKTDVPVDFDMICATLGDVQTQVKTLNAVLLASSLLPGPTTPTSASASPSVPAASSMMNWQTTVLCSHSSLESRQRYFYQFDYTTSSLYTNIPQLTASFELALLVQKKQLKTDFPADFDIICAALDEVKMGDVVRGICRESLVPGELDDVGMEEIGGGLK